MKTLSTHAAAEGAANMKESDKIKQAMKDWDKADVRQARQMFIDYRIALEKEQGDRYNWKEYTPNGAPDRYLDTAPLPFNVAPLYGESVCAIADTTGAVWLLLWEDDEALGVQALITPK